MKSLIYIFLTVLILNNCAYRPLYKNSNFYHPHKIKIIIKSKDRYENNVSIMRSFLNQKLNNHKGKNSNLKLVVSMERSIQNLGVNKDLNSYASLIVISLKYSFYDKEGELTSGNLRNSSTYNLTTNNYANILSLEDASTKLVKSLSNDLSSLILSSSFGRNIKP